MKPSFSYLPARGPWVVLSLAALLLAACESAPTQSSAQSTAQAMSWRSFPQESLRGQLEFTSTHEVRINGKTTRLSPGVRVRGESNTLVHTTQVTGQRVVANYTVDAMGLVHEVWVLTRSELAKGPWPATKEQAQAWAFNAATQSWSRP